MINWKIWKQKGIWYISDICNEDGTYKEWEELVISTGTGLNYLNWLQIKKAIPKEWIEILRKEINVPFKKETDLNIELGDKKVNVKNLNCKMIYWSLINRDSQIPPSIKKWELEFPEFQEVEESMWHEIFQNPYKCSTNTYVQSLQFKILHRIIPCNKKLYDYKIRTDPYCDMCHQMDDIVHFFILCENTKKFWKTFWSWWNNLTKTYIQFTEQEVIEGIIFGFAPIDELFIALNFVIYEIKKFIYQQKLNKKEISYALFLIKLKASLTIEQKRQDIYENNKLYKIIEFVHEYLI
jgi:hypothetical protein